MEMEIWKKIRQRKTSRLAMLLVLAILTVCGLAGCQTAEMKEAKTENQTVTPKDDSQKTKDNKKEKEDEYIDESYVDDAYGEDEEEDLDKYQSDKKSKSSGKTDNDKKTSAETDGTDAPDSGENDNANTSETDENAEVSPAEQDEYNTDPVPEGNPEPVEPQDITVDENQDLSCTLYVECSTILNHMDDLAAGKDTLVPPDGVIYGPATVTFHEGESVYDVLLREMQNNRIHMDSEFVAANNSSYIKAINNLYERDCGSLSGWRYCVNGWYPNYGCSRYQVQNGDTLELHFTCDLGRDLGGDVPEGN